LTGSCNFSICLSDYWQGNFQASIDCAAECCSNNSCKWFIAENYLQLREFEKSLTYFRENRKGDRDKQFIFYNEVVSVQFYREGFALIQMGELEDGRALIEKQLTQLDKKRELGRADGYDYHYAAIYAFQGDQDRALKHLRDYSNKAMNWWFFKTPLEFIQYDILFENLWGNEEFKALVKQDMEEKAKARSELEAMNEL
jgi:tetratricopeptide (TPR) repeat protein